MTYHEILKRLSSSMEKGYLYQNLCVRIIGWKMVSSSIEQNFTNLLINRLSGKAYAIVISARCETITQILDILIEIFGLSKCTKEYYITRAIICGPSDEKQENIYKIYTMYDFQFLSIIDAEWRQYSSVSTDKLEKTDASS